MRCDRALIVLAGLAVSSAAMALPWDTDMADSLHIKGYEQQAEHPADGTVSQDHLLTPTPFTPNYDRMTPEGQALTSPYPQNTELGAKMFGTYCTPCHGDGVTELGPVGRPGSNRFNGVLMLAGPTGVAKSRTDGYIYLTARNGGAIMPYFGWAMSDEELWSIVDHIRTLKGGEYIPPAPPATPEESEEAPE